MRRAATAILDPASRLAQDPHLALRLWMRLQTCSNLIEGYLKGRMQAGCATTLSRFDLMAQLERNPEGLRMGDLSKRLMVSGSNITLLTDQLVKEGFVERAPVANDRRAVDVRLTDAGLRAFRQMAKAHEAWVIEVFSGLPPAQHKALYQLLAKLKSGLQPEYSEKPTARPRQTVPVDRPAGTRDAGHQVPPHPHFDIL